MSSDVDAGPLAANKRAGERVELETTKCVPELGLVPDSVAEHYDAVATTLVEPRSEVPFVGICLLERGTEVEIKSVMVTYADGSRGRFYIRPSQHEALLADGGVYCFAVCGSTPEREILALKIVPATLIDELLGPDPWLDGGDGRSDYAQLAWSNIFAHEEIPAADSGGEQR